MAAYTYTGDEDRYYPGLATQATLGLTVELDEDPGDGRWEPASSRTAQAAKTAAKARADAAAKAAKAAAEAVATAAANQAQFALAADTKDDA